MFIGIEKQLENNTMFYREPVQIDKDWSNMFRFFCSRNKSSGSVLPHHVFRAFHVFMRLGSWEESHQAV